MDLTLAISTAIPAGYFSLLESMGCKISFGKLFSLLSLVVKDLASFPAEIAAISIRQAREVGQKATKSLSQLY